MERKKHVYVIKNVAIINLYPEDLVVMKQQPISENVIRCAYNVHLALSWYPHVIRAFDEDGTRLAEFALPVDKVVPPTKVK